VCTCRRLKRSVLVSLHAFHIVLSLGTIDMQIHGVDFYFTISYQTVVTSMCDKFTEEYVEKRLINKIGVLILVLTSRRSEARESREIHERCHICMQRLETLSECLKCAFRLRAIKLCSRVGEIHGSLGIVVILRATTHDIRVIYRRGD